MVDLGFGLIDRRTVVLLILTMAASQAIYKNVLPIDGSNAITILSDLVLLTGYFYIMRSFYRLPLALISQIYELMYRSMYVYYSYTSKSEAPPKLITRMFRYAMGIVGTSLLILLRLPFRVAKFGEWIRRREKKGRADFFKLLDRVGLVLIAYIATLPKLQNDIKQIGIAGVVFLMIVYVFRGSFTALIADPLDDADQLAKADYVEPPTG